MKGVLGIIFNDAHLKAGNELEVLESVRHLIEYAVANEINRVFFAGDLFDSRSFQRQSVLKTLELILDEMHEAGLTLWLFPGNHDKTIYASYDSFLDVFRHHPCVKFNREIEVIEVDGISITLLPFFSDDMLIPMLEEAKGGDVLLSHFEMAGSTHLGKTSKKTSISAKLLSKWKKVYLGHYHNHHEITKNIVHLPSLRQESFGEDNNKGFTLLYDDLSYEIVKGRFREYRKVCINIDEVNTSEIKALINEYKNNEDTIRFEFTGEDSKLKALDKSLFKGTNIDLKIKFAEKFDLNDEDFELPTVVEHYNKEDVYTSFEEFCKEKGHDHKQGVALIKEFFENR